MTSAVRSCPAADPALCGPTLRRLPGIHRNSTTWNGSAHCTAAVQGGPADIMIGLGNSASPSETSAGRTQLSLKICEVAPATVCRALPIWTPAGDPLHDLVEWVRLDRSDVHPGHAVQEHRQVGPLGMGGAGHHRTATPEDLPEECRQFPVLPWAHPRADDYPGPPSCSGSGPPASAATETEAPVAKGAATGSRGAAANRVCAAIRPHRDWTGTAASSCSGRHGAVSTARSGRSRRDRRPVGLSRGSGDASK